jgi:hypothetical protein
MLEWLFRWEVTSVIVVAFATLGVGFVALDDFKLAKSCFLIGAFDAAGGMMMWGVHTNLPTWERMLVVLVLVGGTGVLFVESLRYVDEKSARKIPPSSSAAQDGNPINPKPSYPASAQPDTHSTIPAAPTVHPPNHSKHSASTIKHFTGTENPASAIPAIGPRMGTGPEAYKDVSDEQVGQWAMEEADKVDGMVNDLFDRLRQSATMVPRPSRDIILRMFERDFKNCCAQPMVDLRTEILRRLGPPAEDPQEVLAWKEITPSPGWQFDPMPLRRYAPFLRRLGLKLKRRAVPRQAPKVLQFIERPLAPENSQFPTRFVATISTEVNVTSGYVVVEFTSPPGSVGTNFASRLILPSDIDMMLNESLVAYLASLRSPYTLEIRDKPFTPTDPIQIIAAGPKPFHVLKVTLFDQ